MLRILIRLFFLIILGVLAFDVTQNGSLEKSNTYRYLKDSGAIDYGQVAMNESKIAFAKAAVWAEQNIPEYYNTTCTHLKPYIDLGYDLSLVLKNNIIALSHNIIVYVNKNYPGFQDTVSEALVDTLTLAKENLVVLSHHLQNYTQSAVQYANDYIKSF